MLVTGTLARAEVVGLPVADTAEPRTQDELAVTGGASFGHDLAFYGLRGTYAALEQLRLFVDFGLVAPKDEQGDFGLQGGAIFSLPDEFIADMALRASVYGMNADKTDVLGGTLMLMSSDETVLDGLYLYGGAGFDVNHTSTTVGQGESGRADLNLAVTFGAIYKVTDVISVFGEASIVDYFSCSVGVRLR